MAFDTITLENPSWAKNSKLTLRQICNALKVELPSEFENIADKPNTVAFSSRHVHKGDVYLMIKPPEDLYITSKTSEDYYNTAIENGAKLIIMDEKQFNANGLKKEKHPVILLSNTQEQVKNFFSAIRDTADSKVVMITGSVGKTTTKDLCYELANRKFNTFAIKENGNTIYRSASHMYKKYGKNGNEVFIQEAGAGRRGSVKLASEMLQPDIFVLTNVYQHHLQAYLTMENLFGDKTSPDENIRNNGIVVTNYDEENIRNHTFKNKVVSFAIDYPDADYRAINIKQDFEFLCFDIYEKETGKSIPIKLRVLGKHNALNAMAAYIVSKNLGMTDEEIQEGFAEFKTNGVRQNLCNIGGVYIDMDCYNVAEESIMTMLRAGESFPVGEGGKRIAIIGGENKLGENVRKRSLAFGKTLSDVKFDQFLICGRRSFRRSNLNIFGDARSIYKGFRKNCETKCELALNVKSVEKYLRENAKPGDVVMLKGIYLLEIAIATDKALGTSYSFDLPYFKKEMSVVEDKGFKSNYFERFNELEIISGPVNGNKLTIPNKLAGYNVFKVKADSFSNNDSIEEIDFGTSIKNISKGAFSDCKNLKSLKIPSNVKVVEDETFSNCSSLETVEFADGVTHIGDGAFSNCENLKRVVIPNSVMKIGDGAFKGSKCVIVCNDDSCAYKYASENCIAFEING